MLDVENRTVWQQACGDDDRNYSEICLKWDVILYGPGRWGKLPNNIQKYREHVTSRRLTNLKKFTHEMSDGDLVVLRRGTKKIYGVGIVCGEYSWSKIFADIDGWDLQHVRRVKWLKKFPKPNPKSFPTNTLKWGFTTQKNVSKKVINWIKDLNITDEAFEKNLTKLPDDESIKEIDPEVISEFLFDRGVASNSINKLIDEIDELERIAKWYSREQDTPSEYETVAYLVVPLLKALGWTPQKMGIEWNNVDLALFKSLPRKDVNLEIVVEAKKKDRSCLTAKSQAGSYAKNRPNCKRLIVTDGLRYGIYVKESDEFSFHSYLNLTDLKSSYPIFDCSGAMNALWAMTPEWKPDS